MTNRTILRMGDSLLYRTSQSVEKFDTKALHRLIQDMQETMDTNNGIGLAAPQIGVNLRLLTFGLDDYTHTNRSDEIPKTVLINPVITPVSNEKNEDWEACISLPGMTGLVSRYTHVHYKGFDQIGNVIDRKVSYYHARVVQHEVDHLDGILYLMRIKDMRNFGFVEEIVDMLKTSTPVVENPS